MKPVLVLLSLLFHIPVFSQEWMEDKEDLNGQVKSVYYISTSGNKENGSIYIEKSSYNLNGFRTRFSSSYSHNGPESFTFCRIFDEQQSYCLIQYNLNYGDTLQKYLFEYTDLGKVVKAKFYDNGEFWSTSNYVYNEAGLVSECFCIIQRDNDTIRNHYEYDESGHKIMDLYVSSDVKQKNTWNYSRDGKLLEEKSELMQASPTTIIKMNDDGTIAEEKVLEHNPEDDRNYVITYTYNINGQVDKEVRRYLDGRFQYSKSFTYSDGNIVFEEYFTEVGKKIDQLVKYEYDAQGNWTKRTEYWDGKLENTRERVIVYY